MGSRMTPQDQELYKAVDEVLHYMWDPIGICGTPQARDEYDAYLPRVFSLLRGGAGEQAIAAYLGEVTSSSMGLSTNPQHDLEVARILVEWKNVIDAKFG